MFGPYLWFCRVRSCCTRTMGAVGTRPSLRPPSFRGADDLAKLGRMMPRECRYSSGCCLIGESGA
jgi:hypothetical protein